MPSTTVRKITGPISILISAINPSPSGLSDEALNASAATALPVPGSISGQAAPTMTPSRMPTRTQKYRCRVKPFMTLPEVSMVVAHATSASKQARVSKSITRRSTGASRRCHNRPSAAFEQMAQFCAARFERGALGVERTRQLLLDRLQLVAQSFTGLLERAGHALVLHFDVLRGNAVVRRSRDRCLLHAGC